MQITATVSRRDLRNLRRTLQLVTDRYGVKTSRQVMGKLLTSASQPLKAGIASRTPTATGILKQSVRTRTRTRRGAIFAETGFIPRGSRARRRHISSAAYAQEYGNVRVPSPKRMSQRALSATRETIVARFRTLMRRDLLSYARRLNRRALNRG